MNGAIYSWHQPLHLAYWAKEIGEPQPHNVLAEIKEVAMTEERREAGLALLYWVLGDI